MRNSLLLFFLASRFVVFAQTSNEYISPGPACENYPVGNISEMEPVWQSAITTSAALGMPSVADLDQDGFPEIISMNSETGWMYILDGRTGNTINQVRVKSGAVYPYPTVADVDGDGFGEIFTIDLTGVIRAYEHDLTLKWTQTSIFTGFGRHLGLADFNQDGKAELYYVNEIRDAETGALLIKGSHGSIMYPSANHWQNELNAVPVAIDILPSPGLELTLGHIIYTVNITNPGGTIGNSLTEARNMNDAASKPADYLGYFPADAGWANQTYSTTAVVDYNQDGNLDIIIGGANGSIEGPTTAFFWDLANNSVKTFTVTRPANSIPTTPFNLRAIYTDMNGGSCDAGETCYWPRGMGSISIADMDGDGQLEASFVSGSSLYALESNFTEKWANHHDFWEVSSGGTGVSTYDFNGDGSAEILYRDELNLYIIDGITGQPLNHHISGTFCSSQTQVEYPIIADVNGDGETEIILSCGLTQNIYGQATATSSNRQNGFIRAYKASQGSTWTPARKVWNQYAYFNTNINDDLSIPKIQTAHHQSLDTNCANALPLNKFLSQSSLITPCGDINFPAAKLDFEYMETSRPSCIESQVDVRLRFKNNGDKAVHSAIPVSFYANNPAEAYTNTDNSPYLETISIAIPGGLQPEQLLDTTITVNVIHGEFELFASLNDIGQKDAQGNSVANEDFYPLNSLNGSVEECDDTPTILSKMVYPQPFAVKAVKIRDNRNCPGEATLNNGEVEVLAMDNTPFPASSYVFTWTNISTNQVVGTTALVTGLDGGTYRILVENTNYGCFGNADTVTVLHFEEWPDTEVVTIEEIQPVSSCVPGTADGIARVLINGSPVDKSEYDIIWEDEQQPGVLAIGDTATNLKSIRYKVMIRNLLTGCLEVQTIDMTLPLPQLAPNPTVTASTNCKNPNGTITAQLLSGSTTDYEYMLIWLSPLQDTIYSTNPSFCGLAAGLYEIRAYDPTMECGRYSDGVEVELTDQTTVDDLSLEIVKPQTACAAPYNGQIRAVIANPLDYSFAWYRGTVVTGPTPVLVGNTATTPDTLGTHLTDIYTLVATKLSSGCSISQQVQLTENITTTDFSYGSSVYCQGGTNPIPNVNTHGGTFSAAPAGLLLDATIGEINLSASIPGNYTITYTLASSGSCPNENQSFVLSITTADEASFSYAQPTYCQNEVNPIPRITGNVGGVFSATPDLVIDANTGEIDLAASIPGTHSITYTTSGACSANSSFDITINASPTVMSVGTSNISCDGFDITWDEVEENTEYRVYVSDSKSFTGIAELIHHPYYSANGLNPGQRYYFKIGLKSTCGVTYTQVDSVDIMDIPTQLNNLIVSNSSQDGFTVSWYVVDQAIDYLIEIDDDPLLLSPEISTTILGTSFTASGLVPETSYYVSVTPNNTCGAGLSSITVANTSISLDLLVSDSLALVALYHATDGDHWNRNDNWLTGPIDSWYGVRLNEERRVFIISLWSNNLVGYIPSEVYNLTGLEQLYLSQNQIEGELHKDISALQELWILHLGNNKLKGSIPKELSYLPYIRQIDLSHNKLSGSLPVEILKPHHYYDSIIINNNNLSELPVYPENTQVYIHAIEHNKFTFEDILRIKGVNFLEYTPQQAIGLDTIIYRNEGQSYTINLDVDALVPDNQYVWFKDGASFDTTDVNHYILTSLTLEDEGVYTCQITNPRAPKSSLYYPSSTLTLYSHPVTIHVTPKNEEATLSISTSKSCIDEEIGFTANGRNSYERYRWFIRRDTGYSVILSDSITSSSTLMYSLDQEGDYTVRLTLSNPYLDDTVLVDHFSVKPSPEMSLLASMNLNTDSLMFTALEAYAADSLTFEWYKVGSPGNIILGNQNTLWVKEAGTYGVTVTNPTGCQTYAETLVIDTRPKTQSISFEAIADKIYGESFALAATASSGLPVSFEVLEGAEMISLSDYTVNVLGVGTVRLRAVQNGNGQYLAAAAVVQSFSIAQAPQQINFTEIPDMLLDKESFTLNASSSVGLPLTFSFSGPIALVNQTLSLLDTGEVTITASQNGSKFYLPAEPVSHTFHITQEIEKDTLHQLNVRIDTELSNIFPLTLSLYQEQNGVYRQVAQESMLSAQLSFENLAEGKYTLRIKADRAAFIPTYLGQQLLMSEAEKISLTQDTEVRLNPIGIPDVLKEIGITLRGVFVQSTKTSNGRIMITKEALDGIPIVGLTLYLVDAENQSLVATTTTDGDGKFVFTKVPPGMYIIKADHQSLPVDASSAFNISDKALDIVLMAGEEISLVSLTEVEEQVTGIEDAIMQQLRFYPNPVEDELHIQLPSALVGGQLKIFDTHGRLVFSSGIPAAKVSCSLAHLSSGHYQLQLSQQGKTYSLKILKK